MSTGAATPARPGNATPAPAVPADPTASGPPTTPTTPWQRRARRGAPLVVPPTVWAWPGYLTLGLGGLAALLAPHLVDELRYVPLLASLVLFGLPHGAVDHLVPGWVRGRPLSRASFAQLIAAYLGLTALGIGLWLVDPLLALALFFLTAVVHWGASELTWFPGQRRRVAFAAARGLVAVILPALAFPTAFDQATRSLLAPFLTHPPDLAPTGWLRILAIAAFALVCALGAGQDRRARLELLGLVAFFALVQPVFAVGLYFIAWHSWRHIVRLATLEPTAAAQMNAGRPRAAVTTVMAATFPLTALSLLGLAGFGALLAVHLTAADQITAVALAMIAALTLPHTLLVAWLDHTAATRARAAVQPEPGVPSAA